jgi:hypothetical protein
MTDVFDGTTKSRHLEERPSSRVSKDAHADAVIDPIAALA